MPAVFPKQEFPAANIPVSSGPKTLTDDMISQIMCVFFAQNSDIKIGRVYFYCRVLICWRRELRHTTLRRRSSLVGDCWFCGSCWFEITSAVVFAVRDHVEHAASQNMSRKKSQARYDTTNAAAAQEALGLFTREGKRKMSEKNDDLQHRPCEEARATAVVVWG